LIPAHGALGAAQAYMATYIVYFSLCCGVFLLWRRRAFLVCLTGKIRSGRI
ncbi:hypothetical protein UZ965_25470, partial [Escherichia coli]|nr:hypothetical protein [Escherichia coli]